MTKHIINEDEYRAVKTIAQNVDNVGILRRLQVIMFRYEGKSDAEIANKLWYSLKRVSQLCRKFKSLGVEQYARARYNGQFKYRVLKRGENSGEKVDANKE
ncbi:MAG: hypothetical protein LBJ12_08025 [Oscillospiraceae bacterium]|nr:hypothetical protein [Oscillospiraceae bacterium]